MFQTSQQGFYLNPNITGAIGFLVMINSVLASTKNRRGLFRIIFIFGLLVIILSNSRSIYLSIISYAFTYLLYNNFKNIKKRRFFYFLLIILMVSFVYLYSSQSVLLYRIDNIISHYSGKNFYSGRQQFWGNLLEEILRKPILGYGTSTTPFNLLDVSLSSHNLYLQVGIQAGIVGIGLLILFFYKLFFYFCESSTREGRIGAAILVSTMIHQIFEVSLTPNKLGL
jgi:O-antigen ligase